MMRRRDSSRMGPGCDDRPSGRPVGRAGEAEEWREVVEEADSLLSGWFAGEGGDLLSEAICSGR